MNEIVKMYNGHPVRIVQQDGEPWFVAKDVCVTLGLDVRSGARGLADDEKGLHTVQTPGGEQNVQIINEVGLYRLIFKSCSVRQAMFPRKAESRSAWIPTKTVFWRLISFRIICRKCFLQLYSHAMLDAKA